MRAFKRTWRSVLARDRGQDRDIAAALHKQAAEVARGLRPLRERDTMHG